MESEMYVIMKSDASHIEIDQFCNTPNPKTGTSGKYLSSVFLEAN